MQRAQVRTAMRMFPGNTPTQMAFTGIAKSKFLRTANSQIWNSNMREKKLVKQSETRGPVDEAKIIMTLDYAATLDYLDRHFGDWDADDAERAATLLASLQLLEERGWEDWTVEDVNMADNLAANVQWLEDHGWYAWSASYVKQVATHVQNLQMLEKMGETASPQRMAEVAGFVEDLRYAAKHK